MIPMSFVTISNIKASNQSNVNANLRNRRLLGQCIKLCPRATSIVVARGELKEQNTHADSAYTFYIRNFTF